MTLEDFVEIEIEDHDDDDVDDDPKVKWTEYTLLEALKNTYPFPEHAVFTKVRNSTGFVDRVRTADAMMFGLWPSRGLDLTGIEVKVSLADWRRELNDPSKADAIGKYCDFWYIVAPRGVVPINDLPDNWGLMEPKRTKLHITKKAERIGEPQPLPRGFIASVLKQFFKQLYTKDELSKEREVGINIGMERARREMSGGGHITQRLQSDIDDLKERISNFQKNSGIDMSNEWMYGRIGTEVAFLLKNRFRLASALQSISGYAKIAQSSADALLTQFNGEDK